MVDRRETEVLVDNPRPSAGHHDSRRPGSDIAKAHADFVMALAARKPCPIALDPEPEDFTARAVCCEALIEDAAQNDPACLIRDAELAASIDAHLGDLKSDITGTLEQVAERICDDRYDGCPRGPFYRRRGP